MNHNVALQYPDNTWAYCRNGRPTGYCKPFSELTEDQIKNWYGPRPEDLERYNREMDSYRKANEEGKCHDGGHATKEEAEECYKQYTLDFMIRISEDKENARQLNRCEHEGCKEYTSGAVWIGAYDVINLCKEHRTREVIAEHVRVGESWDS